MSNFKTASLLQLLKVISAKRRAENQSVVHQFHVNETKVAAAFALSIPVLIKCNKNDKHEHEQRSEDEKRDGNWWINGYQNWDEDAFKKRCREILLNLSSVKFEMISLRYLLLWSLTQLYLQPSWLCRWILVCITLDYSPSRFHWWMNYVKWYDTDLF